MRNCILFCILILSGCTLYDSSFINDPFDPRLPQYSTEGANAAGALINGAVWTARKRILLGSQGLEDGETRGNISFFNTDSSFRTGTLLAFEYGTLNMDGGERNCSVGIFLDGLAIRNPNDLGALENREFALDGQTNFGQFTYQTAIRTIDSLNVGVGTLFIRDVGENRGVVIISGTFGFSIPNVDGTDRTVFSGRFDYEAPESVFRDL